MSSRVCSNWITDSTVQPRGLEYQMSEYPSYKFEKEKGDWILFLRDGECYNKIDKFGFAEKPDPEWALKAIDRKRMAEYALEKQSSSRRAGAIIEQMTESLLDALCSDPDLENVDIIRGEKAFWCCNKSKKIGCFVRAVKTNFFLYAMDGKRIKASRMLDSLPFTFEVVKNFLLNKEKP